MVESHSTAPPQCVHEAAARMLDDLELSSLSKETYSYGVAAFLRFLDDERPMSGAGRADAVEAEPSPFPISGIDEEILAQFNRWLRSEYGEADTDSEEAPKRLGGRRHGDRTRQVYMVAAKHLMNWLDLNGLLPEGVSYERMVRRTIKVRGRRRQGYRRRGVDPAVARVISYYEDQELPRARGQKRLILLRNRALVSLLYDTGARISEALALRREEVLDGRARKVRLVLTKNGRPRTVFISDETRRAIRQYTDERGDGPEAFLFVSHGRGKGQALTPAQAWNIVKQVTPTGVIPIHKGFPYNFRTAYI